MTKEETARWMGYGSDVAAMDRVHDRLHEGLCLWLGLPSYSMQLANGASLDHERHTLANLEEEAVMAVQRWARHAGVDLETFLK